MIFNSLGSNLVGLSKIIQRVVSPPSLLIALPSNVSFPMRSLRLAASSSALPSSKVSPCTCSSRCHLASSTPSTVSRGMLTNFVSVLIWSTVAAILAGFLLSPLFFLLPGASELAPLVVFLNESGGMGGSPTEVDLVFTPVALVSMV